MNIAWIKIFFTWCTLYLLQFGGGFGQSLCVLDADGDNLMDIIVGAPLEYINETGSSEIIDDVGSIYIFFGDSEVNVLYHHCLKYCWYDVKHQLIDQPITPEWIWLNLPQIWTYIVLAYPNIYSNPVVSQHYQWISI